MIYLHENGVTVVATDEAKRGKVYELNGKEYYIARGVSDIKRIVDSGEYIKQAFKMFSVPMTFV